MEIFSLLECAFYRHNTSTHMDKSNSCPKRNPAQAIKFQKTKRPGKTEQAIHAKNLNS